MVNYLLTVAALSCAVGVIEYLFYPSKAKEAARICSAVILVHALLSPVLSFAASLSEGLPSFDLQPPTDIPFEDTYEKTAEDAFKEGICKLLCANYGLKPENVSVFTEGFEVSTMKAQRIIILLRGEAALCDHRGMEAYLDSLSIGACEVRIRIG